MSDYMAQKADEQIEAGLSERDSMLVKIDSLISEINTLTAKVKRYEEALGFYADPLSWDYNQTHDDMTAIESSDCEVPEGLCDNRGGKRARAALNQTSEDK